MPRRPSVYWDEPTKSWRSDSGERGKTGRRKAVYFRDLPPTDRGKRQAEELLKEFLKERDRREAALEESADNPTLWQGVFRRFLADFKTRVEKDDREAVSYQTHRRRLKSFARSVPQTGPWAGIKLGHRRAASIELDDATRWIEEMRTNKAGPQYINGVMASVKAALNWAATPTRDRVPRQILPGNPFQWVKRLSVPKKAKPLPTRVEASKLLRIGWRRAGSYKPIYGRCAPCAKDKSKKGTRCRRSHTKESTFNRVAVLLCRMQINCGTRPSELCRATWGPTPKCPEAGWTARAWKDPRTMTPLLDDDGQVVRDPRTQQVVMDPESGQWWGRIVVFGKTTRATGKVRRIPVSPALTRAIERLREAGLHPVYIFPRLARGSSTDGSWNVNDLGRVVREWRRAAGLDDHLVLYAMRHRIYTRAVHEGKLTADQAGAVGGTMGDTVRRTYLHADDAAIFEHATKIRQGHQSR